MTIKWEVSLDQIIIAVAALIALFVARGQLRTMALQTRATILLSLDQRWESDPLVSIRIELRTLIDRVVSEAQRRWPGLSEIERRIRSGEIYADELQTKRTQAVADYQRLFQICGFFETVGYVTRAGQIPSKDVVNLLGGAILQAGMVFRPHIDKLHAEEGGDARAYEHFLWLLDETEREA